MIRSQATYDAKERNGYGNGMLLTNNQEIVNSLGNYDSPAAEDDLKRALGR